VAHLYNAEGHKIPVGRQLGRGGEGTVYEVVGSSLVAKIYHQPVGRDKAEKLAGMAKEVAPDLLEVSAWPVSTLHRTPGGPLTGFVMPKVTGYSEIHHLYSPAHRKVAFPKANWRFLVHTARNVANAFATVHQHGHVVGDVNQGNVTVDQRATVKLIDCDSFQVRVNGRRFLCEVGVAHFTPPELQDRSFRGVERTTNHDNFGLGVVLFHLLFMGRHPFAGRYVGRGDMPIERAIGEFRFAFSQHAASLQMNPPPHSLRLASISFGLGSLFERAFSVAAARDGSRPRASDWVKALEVLERELRACPQFPGHSYHSSLSACPWCEIERAGGPDLFISVTVAARMATGFNIQAVWAKISAISSPPVLRSLSSVVPAGSRQATPLPSEIRRKRTWSLLIGWGALGFGLLAVAIQGLPLGVALALGFAWLILRSSGEYAVERKKRRLALETAKRAFEAARTRLVREDQEGKRSFQGKRRELEQNKSEYESLVQAYQKERAQLHSQREAMQRRQFLESFFVEDARLRGIGPGLKTSLASYGIETAADVTWGAVQTVPGFGPARTHELTNWKSTIEEGFRFDPNRGVDQAAIAALDRKYALKRQGLERSLVMGAQALERVSGNVARQNKKNLAELRQLSIQRAQAKADASLV